MPQGIPTGHSCSKRIYAFAVLAGACIGKRRVPRRRRKALLRVPVGGQCRKAFPPDTHASAPAVFGLLRRVATLDKKESAFFSHYDPNIVEWFVKMVEERKKHHDFSKEKKAW